MWLNGSRSWGRARRREGERTSGSESNHLPPVTRRVGLDLFTVQTKGDPGSQGRPPTLEFLTRSGERPPTWSSACFLPSGPSLLPSASPCATTDTWDQGAGDRRWPGPWETDVMAEKGAVRSISTGPASLPGRCPLGGKLSSSWNLGPSLAPGGPGFWADPEGRTGAGWHRAGQRIAFRSGGEDLRAEEGTQNGSQAFMLRTFSRMHPRLPKAPCSTSAQIYADSGLLL